MHQIPVPDGPDSSLLLKPGWVIGGAIAVKVVFFPENGALELPTVNAGVLLFSGTNGTFLGACDGNEPTTRRTAAASAVASSDSPAPTPPACWWSAPGALAPMTAQAQAAVRDHELIEVWGRSTFRAIQVVEELKEAGYPAQVSQDLDESVAAADVITCVTGSTEPLIRGAVLTEGTHVDCIGAFTSAMRETDDDVIRRASVWGRHSNRRHPRGDLAQPSRPDSSMDDLEATCETSSPVRRRAAATTTSIHHVQVGRHRARTSPQPVSCLRRTGERRGAPNRQPLRRRRRWRPLRHPPARPRRCRWCGSGRHGCGDRDALRVGRRLLRRRPGGDPGGCRLAGMGAHYDFDLDGPLLGGGHAVDWGDLPIGDDFAENRSTIRRHVKTVLEGGAVPLLLGGDDSIPIPALSAFMEHGPIVILQLDAHIDWRDEVQGERMGLSSNMRRASEMAWVDHIVQVGARGSGSARTIDVQDAHRWGVDLFPMRSVRQDGLQPVVDAIPQAPSVYVALDIDALDRRWCPASSVRRPRASTTARCATCSKRLPAGPADRRVQPRRDSRPVGRRQQPRRARRRPAGGHGDGPHLPPASLNHSARDAEDRRLNWNWAGVLLVSRANRRRKSGWS